MPDPSRKERARLNRLRSIGGIDFEKLTIGLTVFIGFLFIAVGMIGRDVQELQQVCYMHDKFLFCLQYKPEMITVHETYWGLIAFGAFLLAACGLWVVAGFWWPPRRKINS